VKKKKGNKTPNDIKKKQIKSALMWRETSTNHPTPQTKKRKTDTLLPSDHY